MGRAGPGRGPGGCRPAPAQPRRGADAVVTATGALPAPAALRMRTIAGGPRRGRCGAGSPPGGCRPPPASGAAPPPSHNALRSPAGWPSPALPERPARPRLPLPTVHCANGRRPLPPWRAVACGPSLPRPVRPLSPRSALPRAPCPRPSSPTQPARVPLSHPSQAGWC